MRGIVVVGLALVFLAPAGASVTSGDTWRVTGHEDLVDRELDLDRNIVVEDGGTLRLTNVDLAVQSREDGDPVIRVEEGGRLELGSGTRIHGEGTSYVFAVLGELRAVGERDNPVQIEDVKGSSAGATVSRERVSIDGLLVTGSAHLENATFRSDRGAFVATGADSITARSCSIHSGGTVAMVITRMDRVTVQGCELVGGATGLFLSDSNASLEDSVLRGGRAGFGTLVRNSALQIEGSRILDANVSVKLNGDSSLEMADTAALNYSMFGLMMNAGASRPVDVVVRQSSFVPTPGLGHTGIQLSRLDRAVFENVSAGNHVESGISLGPATDLVLKDNLLYGNNQYGLVLNRAKPDVMERNQFGGPNGSSLRLANGSPVELPANGFGQIFEFQRATFHAITEEGRNVPGVNLSVTAIGPTIGDRPLETSFDSLPTNDRGRLTLTNVPTRLVDNEGTSHAFAYRVTASMEGEDAHEVTVEPDNLNDIPITVHGTPHAHGSSSGDHDHPTTTPNDSPATSILPILGAVLTAVSFLAIRGRDR